MIQSGMLLSDIRRRMRAMTWPLAGACVTIYFGYHAIYGDRGVLVGMQLDQKIEEARAVLAVENQKREALERRVGLLRPNSIDRDMIEERARLLLNYGRPDDVIILRPPGLQSR